MAKGTMDRIANILKSNVNEALNRIEDPVKMVDQITRDVEEEVDKAVAALASAMASSSVWASHFRMAAAIDSGVASHFKTPSIRSFKWAMPK